MKVKGGKEEKQRAKRFEREVRQRRAKKGK
jgi:hypothetical protein